MWWGWSAGPDRPRRRGPAASRHARRPVATSSSPFLRCTWTEYSRAVEVAPEVRPEVGDGRGHDLSLGAPRTAGPASPGAPGRSGPVRPPRTSPGLPQGLTRPAPTKWVASACAASRSDRYVLEQQLLDQVTQLPVGQGRRGPAADSCSTTRRLPPPPSAWSSSRYSRPHRADPADGRLALPTACRAGSAACGRRSRCSGFATGAVTSRRRRSSGSRTLRSRCICRSRSGGTRSRRRAAAAVLRAPARVAANDAFSSGLLLDVGGALLRRHDPDRYGEVLSAARRRAGSCSTRNVTPSGSRTPRSAASRSNGCASRATSRPRSRSTTSCPRVARVRSARTLFLADLLSHEVEGTPYEASGTLASGLEWLGLDPADAVPLVAQTRAGLEQVEPLSTLDRRESDRPSAILTGPS